MRLSNIKHILKKSGKLGGRKFFEWGQRLGFNLLPLHFYSETPNIRDLKKDDSWMAPYSMVGVNGADIAGQLDFLKECCNNTLVKKLKEGSIYDHACKKNGAAGYGPIEADFLHCFISQKKPRKIIQVGCGVSTAVMLEAAQEASYDPDLVCIDPYPTDYLRLLGKSKKIRLIEAKVQSVRPDILTDLGDNGCLFIDSTHTVKVGSDVNKLVLEVLPRLKKGSWVHFHDILFPFDYSRHILTSELFFSNESVLLHSFLINNSKYTLRISLSMMHYAHPHELKEFLPHYAPAGNRDGLETTSGHFPSAAYLEVIE